MTNKSEILEIITSFLDSGKEGESVKIIKGDQKVVIIFRHKTIYADVY